MCRNHLAPPHGQIRILGQNARTILRLQRQHNFAVDGNEQDKWLPWLVTAVAACVHLAPLCACSCETLWECVLLGEDVCVPEYVCPENVSLLYPLSECRTQSSSGLCDCVAELKVLEELLSSVEFLLQRKWEQLVIRKLRCPSETETRKCTVTPSDLSFFLSFFLLQRWHISGD